LWASFCLRRTASLAYPKFHPSHCLLCDSLRVLLGDRTPLPSLAFNFSTSSQCLTV
jgi:hypothetical protein